ncbi:hypothetical protein C8R44DRAFT_738330 [Mycena epipterygia]|nr:hypothetical protein C8R44DRAFT_738330 [Mycena epipterygia]
MSTPSFPPDATSDAKVRTTAARRMDDKVEQWVLLRLSTTTGTRVARCWDPLWQIPYASSGQLTDGFDVRDDAVSIRLMGVSVSSSGGSWLEENILASVHWGALGKYTPGFEAGSFDFCLPVLRRASKYEASARCPASRPFPPHTSTHVYSPESPFSMIRTNLN